MFGQLLEERTRGKKAEGKVYSSYDFQFFFFIWGTSFRCESLKAPISITADNGGIIFFLIVRSKCMFAVSVRHVCRCLHELLSLIVAT